MRFKNRPEWLGDDKMSVNIEIECEEGYDAKRFERGDTLRYYFKGPSGVSNPKGEIGMFDLKGRYAGKFKAAEGSAEKHPASRLPARAPNKLLLKIESL